MATWDTSQFNFMAQTADQMADNRFQRLAQEQAENERRFRRDLAEQEANHRFNMDMNRDRREERKFNQAYEIDAAAENRAQQSHEQGLSDARAAAERAAAAERRARIGWEQSQAAARRQREQEDLTQRYNAAQHSDFAQAYYRLSAGDNFADLTPAQQQALKTGIPTITDVPVGTDGESIAQHYRSLQPQDLVRYGIIPEYADEYRRRRAADPHLEQTRANQAAALAAQRQQLADAELERQFAGLSPAQRAAAYLRAGIDYYALPADLRQIVFNGATAGGNKDLSKDAIAAWLNGQPELDNQTAFTALINRQGQGRFTYAPPAPPSSGQRPAPAASAASGQRPAPSSPAPLNYEQQQALLAFEYLSRKGGEVSAADPFKGLDDTQKAAFLRVFGNGAESLTADQVREILNNPYAFSRFGFGYETLDAKTRLLDAVPRILAGQKQNQPAPAPETAETRFQHLSNDQRLALMAFMAMRENHVSFSSLPQDWKNAFNKVFMPDGQQRFKLQTGQGENNLKPGETATQQDTATPEDIAASGDMSAIFGLQTTDQAGENEIFARGKYNAPETTQAILTNFVSEMDRDTRLAYEAFAAIHSGVKLSDLPGDMRYAFFRQFNNGNRFTDAAADDFVKNLDNLGGYFHNSQGRNAFLQLMKQGYQSRQEAVSQAEQAREQAEFQRYQDLARQALIVDGHYERDQYGNNKWVPDTVPDDNQVDALARIAQRYGLPIDKAVEISRDKALLAQLHQMNAEKFRTISQMYGTDFTGLSMPEQAAFLKYYNDFATRYQEIVGDKTESSQLSAEQRQQLIDLAQEWHRLTWDAGQNKGQRVNLPFSFAPLAAELEAESAQADITTFFQQYPEIGEALERNNGDWKDIFKEMVGFEPDPATWGELASNYGNQSQYEARVHGIRHPKVREFYTKIFPRLLEYQRLVQTVQSATGDQQRFRLQANPPQTRRFQYVPSSSTR